MSPLADEGIEVIGAHEGADFVGTISNNIKQQ
jgi:hypothetical protein